MTPHDLAHTDDLGFFVGDGAVGAAIIGGDFGFSPPCAQSARQRRQRVADQLAIVKAALKAGLPVAGAVVDGVPLQFGEPAKAPAGQPEVEIDEPTPRRALFKTRAVPKMKVVL